MALTLEALKTKRKTIKTQVTRFETILKKIQDNTDLYSLDLEGPLLRHNELWQSFDEVQTGIEELKPNDDVSVHESERLEFEDRFYEISGTAKKYIQKLSSLSGSGSAQSASSNHSSLIQNSLTTNLDPGQFPNQNSSHFQLPKLQTPTFYGTFDTWLEFYDSFKAMCHDNMNIPTINKFMYLKACVQSDAKEIPEQDVSKPVNSSTTLVSIHAQLPSQVILGTALVEILDNKGQYHPYRALLDSCSQCNSITDKFASALGLKKNRLDMQLRGVDNLKTNVKYTTSTNIKSRVNDLNLKMSFLIFNEISSRMPSITLNRKLFKIPENISLADPEFHRPADVDILIGAEFYYELLGTGKIRFPGQSAVLQETDLGWNVAGRYTQPRTAPISPMQASCNLIKFQDLPILWELEPENPNKIRSREEKECESHYVKNTTRDDSNRYVVKLPFNNKKDSLECMQGYLTENHMSLIPSHLVSNKGYFLPHHAVVKESSITTKTRVVFDGSAKTSTGISLNDTVMVGPTIQEDLFSILARFRTFLYAMTADIQQMYRQIRVAQDDSLFQKILWRPDPSEPIKIYSLNRVTFGTTCAPFLAIRTLHKLADDERESYPIASAILKRDFYVDDLLTGAHTFQEALELRNDLSNLLNKGSFNLRKWASNYPTLCNGLSDETSITYRSLDPTETIKTLGIHWNAKTDSILYTVNLPNSNDTITKRVILSQTSKLFDPLGLLGPVVLSAKIMIQQLWKRKLTWDTPVPVEVQKAWIQYRKELPLLNDLRFDRCIMIPNSTEIHLHGFCDASEKAYGACLYLRSSGTQGNHHCALMYLF
ncbi:uncharacterized protein LOC117170034 [Belonocnema kinseyi]|uniref:uncharacterized protein LOC117170034 n=1 Tax=Belonocnema kinseyi TaxID=2817044 RepID=UPI00143D7315|nr:uncharacterized protein LOC117170034 [Belonocnema kinseyi]